jgi:hypothetical protein
VSARPGGEESLVLQGATVRDRIRTWCRLMTGAEDADLAALPATPSKELHKGGARALERFAAA